MKQTMKHNILIYSGSAGCGKGTVLKRAREICPALRLSVSMTTRAPREGEQNGREYYFVTREEFLATLAEDGFLEHTEYCGNFYGTPKKQFFQMIEDGFVPVLEIETDGAEQVMKKLPEHLSVFLTPPDFATLEARLRGRGTETEDSIKRRLGAAKEELFRSELYQNVVINFDNRIEDAARAVVELVEMGETQSDVLVRDRAAFLASFQNQ
ncbi:MAG: guanylate kinase [Clostridia bacterium]|nr:guanylate kinase [Clostridia bacterium]